MPLFEEKLISPFAIRYSQERIRPTFQDGRELELALSQIEALDCASCRDSGLQSAQYSILLRAPFPPIEIIRWQPRRNEDGSPSSRGVHVLEPRWITFDNRRLNCLQKAAAAQWPKNVAAVVRVLYDMPVEKSAIRKMEHASAGLAVRLGRLHEVNSQTWDWMAETRGCGATQAVVKALELVQADDQSEHIEDLEDAPSDMIPSTSRPVGGSPPRTASQLLDLAARHERSGKPEINPNDCPERSLTQEDRPPRAKSVTADQLLTEWLRPKLDPTTPPPAYVEPATKAAAVYVEPATAPPAWSAETGLASPVAARWGQSLLAAAAPMRLPASPWLPATWQSPLSTPPTGFSVAAPRQQWPLQVSSPPGLLPLPVPPGPLPRNVPAFPYLADVSPTPATEPLLTTSNELERGLADGASASGGAKVSAAVAQLFALAASEGKECERSLAPKSAGEDLLNLLKQSASPQHEICTRSVGANAFPVSLAIGKHSSSSSCPAEVERSFPSQGQAHGKQAGRELLGLLKPDAPQQDLMRPSACSDVRDRIALGIWDALGQTPKSVSF